MPSPTTPAGAQPVTRSQARRLSALAGKRQEPYRGYGHELPDGRFVFCAPDGNFYVRTTVAEPLRELVTRCDGPEGVRADGSNIDTLRAHAALGDLDNSEAAQ